MLFKLFQSLEKKLVVEDGELPDFFYEARITLIPATDKDQTQRENCTPTSLITFDAEVLNEALVNKILQNIKESNILSGVYNSYVRIIQY